MKIRIVNQSKIYFLSLVALVILSLNASVYGQVPWDGDSTGITNHLGYVNAGRFDEYTARLLLYGNNWNHFVHMRHLTNSDITGRINMASDGMLFRNFDPSPSYMFSFRNSGDSRLVTIYNDGRMSIGANSYSSMPTSTKLRVIDPTYPSIMVAKDLSNSGDFSVASGTGLYSNLSTTNDAVLRASSGDLILTARYTDAAIRFGTNSPDTARMIILGNGNVGIGTDDPEGYKLAVAGDIIAEEIVVKEQADWPDYVFDDTYKLASLNDVENFIKTNKHLPDIPSAEEIAENGLSLGEMQAKLLQKVEELTLYIIEQDKRLEKLINDNEKLKNKLQ